MEEKIQPPKKSARIAGSLYLGFILTCAFTGVVFNGFTVSGDAINTAKNILNSEWLFHISFLSDLISALLFLLSAWALYVLLKPIDKNLALLFFLLNACGVAVQSLNALNQSAVFILFNSADWLNTFDHDQLRSLGMLFLKLHGSGFMIAQIFYGAWLFPLGYLVLKSGFFPRFLGVLLIMDGFAVLIWFFQFFLFPELSIITYPCFVISFVAEFSLSLWLIIKGVKAQPLK
jgi:hypothetical protein